MPRESVPDKETTITRLEALERLDMQIADILSKGSRVINALTRGKRQADVDDEGAKDEFDSALEDYNQLIGAVNAELRNEIQRLNAASSATLLPLQLPIKTNTFRQDKESEIWQRIYQCLDTEDIKSGEPATAIQA